MTHVALRLLAIAQLMTCHLGAHPAYGGEPRTSGANLAERVRAYRVAHEKEILTEFSSLLAIPNHASDAAHIRENANAIMRLLESRHIKATLLESAGASPVVFGELAAPGATTTVTFYAHYDGQPTDAKAWSTDPFSPTLRTDSLERGGRRIDPAGVSGPFDPSWRLYARSASDDKAPIIGLLAALDALRAAGVAPSVNLKFFFEGEEEVGSPHLAAILQRYDQQLATDLWILCDGPMDQTGQMQIFFGARGGASLDITVYGPNRSLHSGHYGNWAPNPIVMLTHLLDSMRDEDARILIAGFYDDVRALTQGEKRAMSQLAGHDAELKRTLGIKRTEGEPAPLAQQVVKPALNVRGIQGGRVGVDAANVIESEARASIDFRLVPEQTPERVRSLVERHIARQGYWVVHEPPDARARLEHARIALLEWGSGGYPGARTSMDLPVSRAVVSIIEDTLRAEVIRAPSLGGSIPMYLFAGGRRQPVIGVPIANYDNNQHAANENIRLGNLWAAIEIYAGLFANLGRPTQ
ncbi:MAG: M20/M25/M40 family metallo-hydrolase [Steroidobacteraceae bacterium]